MTAALSLIQYWDQADPPDPIAERMQQWRQQHPGWRYQRFNRQTAAAFVREHYGLALEDAFLDIRLPAMQADVLRIAALLAWGGLWIDAATTCFSPVEHWIDLQAPLLLLRQPHQAHPKVCTGVIYAQAPQHPLINAAWQLMAPALLARSGEKVYRSFGPGVLRDLLASGAWDHTLIVRPVGELSAHLRFGSSFSVLPAERHWSQRQQSESLYLSGGSPSASHCRKEAS